MDFQGLLTALNGAGVEFLVIGGVAGNLHGSARFTQDLDIVYARTPENLRRLAASLAPLHPYLRGAPPGLPFHLDPETLQAGLNFTLVTDIGPIDLLGMVAGGGGYEDLLPRVEEKRAFGHPVRCLDLPTLIKVKRAAGRPKDFEAIAELEALLEERGG